MPGVDIRKDDNVMVISGKDRGKTGRVVNVLPGEGKLMVEGVARAHRHLRIRQGQRGAQEGGIILKELFIDISNVQLVCRHCNRATRLGHAVNADGNKVRVCRRCGGEN